MKTPTMDNCWQTHTHLMTRSLCETKTELYGLCSKLNSMADGRCGDLPACSPPALWGPFHWGCRCYHQSQQCPHTWHHSGAGNAWSADPHYQSPIGNTMKEYEYGYILYYITLYFGSFDWSTSNRWDQLRTQCFHSWRCFFLISGDKPLVPPRGSLPLLQTS